MAWHVHTIHMYEQAVIQVLLVVQAYQVYRTGMYQVYQWYEVLVCLLI